MTITVYGETAMHTITAVTPAATVAFGSVVSSVGGPGGVVGLQLARLGRRARLVSCVGDDATGRVLRSELAQAGVDCSALTAVTGKTTHVLAVVDAQLALAADLGIGWRPDLITKHIQETDGLTYVSGFPDLVPTLRDLGARGCRPVVDVGFKPLLARPHELLEHVESIAGIAGVCVVSGAELAASTRSELTGLCLANGVDTVLVTLAAGGVLVSTASGTEHLPAHNVVEIDPLCTGDAFVAGYLCAMAEGRAPVEAAAFGQAVAACKIGMLGGFPDRFVVEALLGTAAESEAAR